MSKPDTCPNCGNRNPEAIQDNGVRPMSQDYTLLCVAMVEPAYWAFAPDEPELDRIGPDGKVPCGMQWSPNI